MTNHFIKKSLLLLSMFYCFSFAGLQTYTVEGINDQEFSSYPPPPLVHPCTFSFSTSSENHNENIDVNSLHIRNSTIKIENTGQGTIQSAYLFGPHGWDTRRQDSLAAQISKGAASKEEKFYRVHEWEGYHIIVGGLYSNDPDGARPLYYINSLGQVVCSEHASTIHSLSRYIPPLGSVWGKRIRMTGHGAGEVTFDNGQTFMAYDGLAGYRWVYYDYDNKSPVSWEQIDQDPVLATRIRSLTGWDMEVVLPFIEALAVGRAFGKNSDNYDYDLRPNESITLHFDMRGRTDRVNTDWETYGGGNRNPCDYGSGVYCYKPDFSQTLYQPHVVEEQNITQTGNGLVPSNPGQTAFIVFGMKTHPWHLVGANIKAFFKTAGKVYITSHPYNNTTYPTNPSWRELSSGTKEYGSTHSIEGKGAFWVKFEFAGAGSGLDSVDIKSEMFMNPLVMPGLEYGTNRVRFTAEDMGGSSARITFTYDDQSPIFTYQKATSNYGRHIRFRVGGILENAGAKPEFWRRVNNNPNGAQHITITIHQITGTGSTFGQKVRTLFSGNLKWGLYKMYWDGRDDNGNLCPANEMYCSRIDGQDLLAERMYLFPEIWPVPNEMKDSVTSVDPPDQQTLKLIDKNPNLKAFQLHDMLHFKLFGDQSQPFGLRIYDMTGRMLWHYGSGANAPNYSVMYGRPISAGVYLIDFLQGKRRSAQRLLVTKPLVKKSVQHIKR